LPNAYNSAYVQTETLNFTFARPCWRRWFVSTWGHAWGFHV